MLHCIVVQHRHLLQHLTRAPQPSIQPIQESTQQAAQQTAQNDTTTEQVSVAKPKSASPKTIKAAKKKYCVESELIK